MPRARKRAESSYARGALPVNGSKATESRRLRVEPYTTQTLEYFFYFPAPGAGPDDRFPHYPVQVARDEQIVGGSSYVLAVYG